MYEVYGLPGIGYIGAWWQKSSVCHDGAIRGHAQGGGYARLVPHSSSIKHVTEGEVGFKELFFLSLYYLLFSLNSKKSI